jgi:hypothetical protein
MRYRKGMTTNTATAATAAATSIAAFVRSQPLDKSADDVIAAGKALGLDVKRSNVHTQRYYMKTQGLRAKAKRPATSASAAAATTTAAARSGNGVTPPVATTARAAIAPTVVLVPAPAGDMANAHAELARQLRVIALRIGVDHAQRELVELARVVGASA